MRKFAILVPVVSIVSVMALSARAEEPKGFGQNNGTAPKAGPARPAGPAMRSVPPRQGQVQGQQFQGQQLQGQGQRQITGQRQGPARMGAGSQGSRTAYRSLPQRNFGGRPYRGRVAWQGGRWHHQVRNGRDGWWWDVGGVWYYYPQMVDGPPAYVSDVEYADDAYMPDDGAGYPPPAVAAYPAPPPPDPAASAVGGAVIGGILGGVLSGRPDGAIAGAVAGGTVGAIAGAQAASRPGYYFARGGCYYRYPSGQYAPVDPGYCN